MDECLDFAVLCCPMQVNASFSGLIICPSNPTAFLKINGFRITSELPKTESLILAAEEVERINTCHLGCTNK
jgi:hypothetical protein